MALRIFIVDESSGYSYDNGPNVGRAYVVFGEVGLSVADLDLFVLDGPTDYQPGEGAAEHWVRLDGVVEELYDVKAFPQVTRPLLIGTKKDEIRTMISME